MTVRFLVSSTQRRGAEVAAHDLAEAMSRLGVETAIAAIEAGVGDNRLPLTVLGAGRRDPRMWRSALTWIEPGDTVVACGGSTLWVASLLSRLRGCRFVYRNIGDPEVWANVAAVSFRIGAPLRNAYRIIALYEDAATYMSSKYNLPRDRFAVIANGADADRFSPDAKLADDGPDLLERRDGAERWIGYVGALSEEKRPLMAIEVAERCGFGIFMAGDGLLRDEVREAAERSSTPVRLLGQISDVRGVYAASDVTIIPSRTEGIPGVAVESLLSGTPVAAFDVGGLRDVLGPNPGGFLAPADDVDALVQMVGAAASSDLDRAETRRAAMGFDLATLARRWKTALGCEPAR